MGVRRGLSCCGGLRAQPWGPGGSQALGTFCCILEAGPDRGVSVYLIHLGLKAVGRQTLQRFTGARGPTSSTEIQTEPGNRQDSWLLPQSVTCWMTSDLGQPLWASVSLKQPGKMMNWASTCRRWLIYAQRYNTFLQPPQSLVLPIDARDCRGRQTDRQTPMPARPQTCTPQCHT